MQDVLVSSALSQIKRTAETARATIGTLDLEDPSAVDRLGAAAGQIGLLRSAVTDSSLRYQALHPVFVPAVPEHIPEFLRTLKSADQIQNDALAEKRGRQATISSHDHNVIVDKAIAAYDAAAFAAANEFRSQHASVMDRLIATVAAQKLKAMLLTTTDADAGAGGGVGEAMEQ